jgi:hypothetical protein
VGAWSGKSTSGPGGRRIRRVLEILKRATQELQNLRTSALEVWSKMTRMRPVRIREAAGARYGYERDLERCECSKGVAAEAAETAIVADSRGC